MLWNIGHIALSPQLSTPMSLLCSTFINLREIGRDSIINLPYSNPEVKLTHLIALPAAHNEFTRITHQANASDLICATLPSNSGGGGSDGDDAASFYRQMGSILNI
ncbi:hypothetical protein OCU04_001460 [Sclerotinia nivalis]|uniref:Uncharacterized protein n=1 Tax=Sclerotinia nivalis TaxID=352851 RepID=A0A9X0DPR2_9HELO|nr:hypothetical protein OCU04_001460 [Sclerotinia nivalis]